ncbi:MAG: carboxypeptidase-like regulatory domain-containing protein [Acidobacteriota bacterium]
MPSPCLPMHSLNHRYVAAAFVSFRTLLVGFAGLLSLWASPGLWAQGSDLCADAPILELGQSAEIDFTGATSDGDSSCDAPGTPDRWFRWVAPHDDLVYLLGPERSGVEMSVHTGCPGTSANQIRCAAGMVGGHGEFGVDFRPLAGETYYLRVAEVMPQSEPYPIRLTPGGTLTGRVTDGAGAPLADVEVFVFQSSRGASTDADGRYRIEGLSGLPQTLIAGLSSPYVAELYNDIPCPLLRCGRAGDEIVVPVGGTAAVDFSLELGGTISGVLTDAETGEPLAVQQVMIEGAGPTNESFRAFSTTGAQGRFTFQGLRPGAYAVLAFGELGYVREYWPDSPCIPGTCGEVPPTPIVVEAGDVLDAVNFTLDRGLSIRGSVRDADGEPVEFEGIELRDTDGRVLISGLTRAGGGYSFDGLLPGSYFVSTFAFEAANEVWPDVPCAFRNTCPVDGATPIVLTDASVDGVDFDLSPGARLDVEVKSELSGEALLGASIALFDAAGDLLGVVSNPIGAPLFFDGVPAGEYRALAFFETAGFNAELYQEIDCGPTPESCGPVVAGTPIVLAEGENSTITFTIELNFDSCLGDERTLCLTERRFAVSARWQTPGGGEGEASAIPLDGVGDSGTFYFFDPDNTELVVKVLDGCDINGRFWVFAAGLTDVAVELTVEDAATGDTQTYVNPLGSAFQPIQDTSAFDQCADAGVGPPAQTAPAPEAEAILAELQREIDAERRRQVTRSLQVERAKAAADPSDPVDLATALSTCEPSADALCLGTGGRFQVEASWQTPDGDSGRGQAIPFRRDTGLFWFFNADNVEIVIKVLDACGEPFNRFWVFAGGLTDVAVELRVTDTVTGDMRVYQNPQGESFRPVQDTAAFETCP